MAYLHRFIFYTPETVLKRLRAGQPTGLPRGILQLPIFNKTVPVYMVRFLGKLVVYRDHRYVRSHTGPKDIALLVHLALRCGEPGTSVAFDEVCRNFWSRSQQPSRNASHALQEFQNLSRNHGGQSGVTRIRKRIGSYSLTHLTRKSWVTRQTSSSISLP